MAGIAKVLEFLPSRPLIVRTPHPSEHLESGPVRLIPGSEASLRPAHQQFRVAEAFPFWCKNMVRNILPDPVKLIHPSQLGTSICDLIIIIAVLVASVDTDQLALPLAAFYFLLFFVSAAQGGLYRVHYQSVGAQVLALGKALLWTAMLSFLAIKGAPRNAGLLPVFFVTVVNLCLLTVFRVLCDALQISCDTPSNVLVVGEPVLAQKVIDAVNRSSHSRLCVKGLLPEPCFSGKYDGDILKTLARQECIDELIVATRDLEFAQNIAEHARANHLSAKLVLDIPRSDPSVIEHVSGMGLLGMYEQPLPEWRLAFKRLCDVTLATLGLLATSPMLLLIGSAIKLDSRGPILYRSVRIGHRGRRFTCFKFRTMAENADAEKESLRNQNEREGAFFKILNDPRITRVGSFLRRYSLDELPQLCNVARGEMSLVGPRPHPPDDVDGYSNEHLQRLDFIPGMTGLWQVTARQDPSFERCVALDVEYIKRWSPALDFRILCKTVIAVLQGSGA